MQTDIAMLIFFTIQVVFNIGIMMKTDRIEEHIKDNDYRIEINKKRLDLQNERMNIHGKHIFRKPIEKSN